LTWRSPEHPANLDAGNPYRHDESSAFSCSVGERKLMKHIVVKDSFVE
jgi:hypothetical protein